jgi:hypothetical protein
MKDDDSSQDLESRDNLKETTPMDWLGLPLKIWGQLIITALIVAWFTSLITGQGILIWSRPISSYYSGNSLNIDFGRKVYKCIYLTAIGTTDRDGYRNCPRILPVLE